MNLDCLKCAYVYNLSLTTILNIQEQEKERSRQREEGHLRAERSIESTELVCIIVISDELTFIESENTKRSPD